MDTLTLDFSEIAIENIVKFTYNEEILSRNF